MNPLMGAERKVEKKKRQDKNPFYVYFRDCRLWLLVSNTVDGPLPCSASVDKRE
ncbi:hypothetical protein RUM44_011416 [Polyplax serrata]|uniref:Uncharacterized protein n=1 Tax=Polyplax serrata TaxID=468196 RepID=A0ABR1AQM6_POLSC